MFRIALKNVLARKGRLLLYSLAVIAGCTFLSGVFIFSDTINDSIDRIFATAYEKTDAYVRSSVEVETDFGDPIRGKLDDTIVDQVAALPGVAEAAGDVQSAAYISNAEGELIGPDGPPKFGAAFLPSSISPWELEDGSRAPSGPNEVVIDKKSAKEGSIKVGETVNISASESRPFTVVGIVTFNGKESTGGPTWAFFDLPTAEEFVVGEAGRLDGILVRGDGSVSETALQAEIQNLFDPAQVEVLTGEEIIKDNQDQLAEQFGAFTTFLTIFAAIALIVGGFVIYNVFKISTAHRLRENALMRAIGAHRGQVIRALFVEAAAIGLIGGVLGFAGGYGLAYLVNAGLNAAGYGTGESMLVISPNSFLTTVVVGLVVTLFCALFPALRAGRVPPLAAMRDVSVDRSSGSRKRLIVSIVAGAVAALGIVLGLASDPLWLAPGILGLFVAVVAFGPIILGPLSNALTKPLGKLRGVTGQVAGRNAARSPERTALTAAALGIGLALLVAVSTFGSSLQSSVRKTIGESFVGDFAVSSKQQSGTGLLPATLVDDLNELPQVGDAAALGGGPFDWIDKDGDDRNGLALVTDPVHAEKLINLDFQQGGWADITGDKIGVSKDIADDEGWTTGSTIDAQFIDGSTGTLTVAAIFDEDLFGNFLASRDGFDNGRRPPLDFQIVASSAPDATQDDVRAAITTITDEYPTAKAQTRGEYIDSQLDQFTGFLNFIYALLMMSVFIAILGIVLTLLLSVYERRRELGLMRAVGTTHPQVRGSVRWEAMVTALFGALLGTGLGLVLGWIVVKALNSEGIDVFSVSPGTILIFAVIALVAAWLAAFFPARRAAKADILQAIATT